MLNSTKCFLKRCQFSIAVFPPSNVTWRVQTLNPSHYPQEGRKEERGTGGQTGRMWRRHEWLTPPCTEKEREGDVHHHQHSAAITASGRMFAWDTHTHLHRQTESDSDKVQTMSACQADVSHQHQQHSDTDRWAQNYVFQLGPNS